MKRRVRQQRFVPRPVGGQLGAGMVSTMSALGNALRTYRLRAGLSQRQVARALGSSQVRVSMWERGRSRHLTEDDLRRLSALFKVRADVIRRLIPPPPPLLPPFTALARLLRARREELGLSRVELARRLGSSTLHVGTLERTAIGIRYEMMLRLCEALDLEHRVLAPFVAFAARQPGSPLGLAIRERRKELGLSAAKLGVLAGITKTAVRAIETGRVALGHSRSAGTIRSLAAALDLDAAALEALRPPPEIPPATAAPQTIGGYIARRRLRRRWSQAFLAERAGLGTITVWRLERNEGRPDPSTLELLAAALEIDPAPLLRMAEKRRPARSRR